MKITIRYHIDARQTGIYLKVRVGQRFIYSVSIWQAQKP